VVEESVAAGCVGEQLAAHFAGRQLGLDEITLLNLGDCFVPHGKPEELRTLCGIDAPSIVRAASALCGSAASSPAEAECEATAVTIEDSQDGGCGDAPGELHDTAGGIDCNDVPLTAAVMDTVVTGDQR
jgi:hypothetical protein